MVKYFKDIEAFIVPESEVLKVESHEVICKIIKDERYFPHIGKGFQDLFLKAPKVLAEKSFKVKAAGIINPNKMLLTSLLERYKIQLRFYSLSQVLIFLYSKKEEISNNIKDKSSFFLVNDGGEKKVICIPERTQGPTRIDSMDIDDNIYLNENDMVYYVDL